MASRLNLQTELSSISGVSKVYFQPPANTNLEYPCIVYSRTQGNSIYANNKNYRHLKSYNVTVIDRNPDSGIADYILSNFELCSLQRTFVVDRLNHWALQLYY